MEHTSRRSGRKLTVQTLRSSRVDDSGWKELATSTWGRNFPVARFAQLIERGHVILHIGKVEHETRAISLTHVLLPEEQQLGAVLTMEVAVSADFRNAGIGTAHATNIVDQLRRRFLTTDYLWAMVPRRGMFDEGEGNQGADYPAAEFCKRLGFYSVDNTYVGPEAGDIASIIEARMVALSLHGRPVADMSSALPIQAMYCQSRIAHQMSVESTREVLCRSLDVDNSLLQRCWGRLFGEFERRVSTRLMA